MENQQQFTGSNVPATSIRETYSAGTVPDTTTAPGTGTASPLGTTTTDRSEFPPPLKRQGHDGATATRADADTSREYPGGHHTGSNLVNKVKGVAAQGHGLGESLRGNFNAAVDTAFNDKKGQERNEAIADKGAKEVVNKEFDHEKMPRKLA